jgi:hypothetical protein
MNNTYEDIKETLIDIGSSESSIGKVLREFGYETFPEGGIDDTGKDKLIRRALEIETTEAKLIPPTNSDIKTIERIFAKASGLNGKSVSKCEKNLFERRCIEEGANQFIKRALGFKRKTIKTANEMGTILYQTGMALSVEEGKRIAPSLDYLRLYCGTCSFLRQKILCIDKIENQGEEIYKIMISKESPGVC